MEKLKKILTYSVLRKVFFLLGCVYHCFDISMIYFSYKTSTNVRYESQTFVDIPDVTLFYYNFEQIKDKNKTDLGRDYRKPDGTNRINLNNLTLCEQMNKLADEPVKIQDCFYRWNIGSDLKCHSLRNYTKSFDAFTYCVTLFSQHGEEQEDEMFKIKSSGIILKTMINVELRKLERSLDEDDILVKLHDRKEKIKLDFIRGTLLISRLQLY